MTDIETEKIVSSLVGKDAGAAYIGFLKMMKKIDVNEIRAVYSNPSKAPTFSGLKIDEKNALVASVVFFKAKEKVDEKEQKNFIDWLIGLKDAPFSIKAMSMFQEVHPYLKESDYWENDMKGKLFDAYPALMGGRD